MVKKQRQERNDALDSFEIWWHMKQGNRMSHSKYLARKAYMDGYIEGANRGVAASIEAFGNILREQ